MSYGRFKCIYLTFLRPGFWSHLRKSPSGTPLALVPSQPVGMKFVGKTGDSFAQPRRLSENKIGMPRLCTWFVLSFMLRRHSPPLPDESGCQRGTNGISVYSGKAASADSICGSSLPFRLIAARQQKRLLLRCHPGCQTSSAPRQRSRVQTRVQGFRVCNSIFGGPCETTFGGLAMATREPTCTRIQWSSHASLRRCHRCTQVWSTGDH